MFKFPSIGTWHVWRVLVVASSVLALSACSGPKAEAKLAPEKPLTQAEQSLLQQLESTPVQERTQFMEKNRAAIMASAGTNSTFGKKLNEILGVKP